MSGFTSAFTSGFGIIAVALLGFGAPLYAQQIGTVDYSDTFTFEVHGGLAGRANGVFGAANIAAYRVENLHGNPTTTWFPQTNFSFNDIPGSFGAGPVCLATAAGNPGAATGFAQSGGGDFSFAYGIRTNYVVTMDAFLSPGDRTDISSLPNAGDTIFAQPSLSVFFRRNGAGNGQVGIYNGTVETTLGESGIDNLDDNWHKLGVHFNQDAGRLGIYIDDMLFADLDLTTFEGGAYQNYSNGAVGAGGAGAFVRDKVNWFDNFQVGAPCTEADDFNREDGSPVDGWTEFTEGWRIESNRLVVGPTPAPDGPGGEAWAWYDVPTGPNVTIEFDIEWLAPGTNAAVGRHGGCYLFANSPTWRGDAAQRGYYIDWIDRDSDRGIRLTRDDGADTLLVAGQLGDATADPPRHWKIEVDGPSIRFWGDGALLVDLVDNTYRGGLFGFWQWSGGEHAAYDNLCITEPASVLTACCTASESTLAGSPITFDAGCSTSIGGGDIVRHTWDFGDGNTAEGPVVEHTYDFSDIYTVTLEIENELGETATTEKEICVNEVVVDYSEDFNRADGPVDGWSVFAGDTWRLEGERLALGPAAVEHWIWAGEKPLYAPRQASFEFDIEFLAPGDVPAVGRHGGFQFHCTAATQRSGAGAFSGYFIDWIDRDIDRGIRLTRVDNGAFNELVAGQGADAPADPPARWRVEVDGAQIRVFGDDVLYVDVTDTACQGGFFGFWSWQAGQEIAYDNLTVSAHPIEPCCEVNPPTPHDGQEITFDATSSRSLAGVITSYDWDFGDGNMASGPVVTHTYAFADVYTVSLNLSDSAGNTAQLVKTVSVAESLEGYRDCFDRADGPVDGWTVHAGLWNIVDGALIAGPSAGGGQSGEQQAFAGDPPQVLPASYTIEFDWEYLAPPDSQPVGRHAGAFFEFNQPGIRWAAETSGYQLWWIDRTSDRGLTLARWNAGGGFTVLNPPGGTGDLFAQPPRRMRIEVNGDNIKVFGDDVLAIDVNDGTYRGGLFGLWTWDGAGQHVAFDNLRIWDALEPEFCQVTDILQGDCNNDGTVNVADIVCLIDQVIGGGFVLVGGGLAPCTTAGGNSVILNANGDAALDISDVAYLANFLFGGGPPPAMGTGCISIDQALGCLQNPACP